MPGKRHSQASATPRQAPLQASATPRQAPLPGKRHCDEIADQVWGKDKHVEAADGINTAIRRVRRALDDSTDQPRFIQTVVGQGYQFIGEVEGGPEAALAPEPLAAPAPGWHLPPPRALLVGALVLIGLLAGLAFLRPKAGPVESFVAPRPVPGRRCSALTPFSLTPFSLHLHPVVKRALTFELSKMFGTQERPRA